MKRQRIQLIVLAALLLICLGGYCLLRRMDFSEKEPEAVSVLDLAKEEEISWLSYSGQTSWQFEKQNGIWTDGEDASVKLSQAQVSALTEYLFYMDAQDVIEKPEDPAAYGLAEPSGTVEIGLTDGSVRMLYIGGQNELTQDYYVRTDAGDTVYTVNSYEAEAFAKDKTTFLDTETASENTVLESSEQE